MENKEKIRSLAENVWAYIAAFLRWGVLGLLVGGLGGFVGALFAKSVAWATAMRGANPWLLYLLPVGGLAIVGVYKLCRVSGVGTNEVFEGVRSNKGVSILLAPAIFLGTTITHLLGGSAGREGAALQIGGSVATFFGKLFRLNEEDRHILTMTPNGLSVSLRAARICSRTHSAGALAAPISPRPPASETAAAR